MIRILHVYPQLNNAGTEMVIMNLYRNIDKSKIQFDFCVQKKGELDDFVREMGGRIFYIPYSKNYLKQMIDFYKDHPEFQTIHTHTHKEMGDVLKAAYIADIKTRIAHSHNSRADLPRILKIYKRITSYPIEKYATHFIACSSEAADWLFPHKKNECMIWNNGIDLKRFEFSIIARQAFRKEYNIPDDATVICHVGRFARQKNHEKIICLLNQILKTRSNYYAMLVGTGPLLEEMKNKAETDRILFLGNRTDVPTILSASDLFLFPSLWEGLGIVAVEAQANGIHCIASDRVPTSADLRIELFSRISLSSFDDEWINEIEKKAKFCETIRSEKSELAKKSPYDIKVIAKNAEKFYLSGDF